METPMFNARTQSLWPWAALSASAMMLAGAQAFEIFGQMPPCPLCLRQREVYWAAIAVAVAGLAAARLWPALFIPRATAALLAVAFLAGAGVAFYHAGVEYKVFPAPESCSASVAIKAPESADALWAELGSNKSVQVVSCSDAPWRLFGVSMAGYNGLISLLLAAISVALALVPGRPVEARE
jgi:disulfide bond formation protein DsbB